MLRLWARLWTPPMRPLACALFAFLLVRTAWVSDDAFITLRTIDNWLHGYGLRWNAAERVQTYSHPLWMLLLTPAVALSGSAFFGTLGLSLVVSTAVVSTVARVSRWPWSVLLLLSLSPSFVDFCASGLENPLTHLGLALLAAWLLREAEPLRRYAVLALLAGFASVTRHDALLFYVPALILYWPSGHARGALRRLGLGAAPVAAWHAFAWVYYGFALPNPAYAKLGFEHPPLWDRLGLGVTYVKSSLLGDPVAGVLLALALVLCVRERRRAQLVLGAGALLYLGYTVWIGGDFMRGRFLAAPVLAAALCCAQSEWLAAPARRALCVGGAFALSLLGAGPPALTGADFGRGRTIAQLTSETGVRDERAAFFPHDSLWNSARSQPDRADHPWSAPGHRLRKQGREQVLLVEAVGHLGYYAGPRVHLVDVWAIGDPLLARLPPVWGESGHYVRGVPAGYLESLRDGADRIEHRGIAAYYAALRAVVRDPLFSSRRVRALVDLHGGRYGPIERHVYARGPELRLALRVQNPSSDPLIGLFVWNAGRRVLFALDLESAAGEAYTPTLRIGPHGVRAEGAVAFGEASLGRLAERGVLAIGVSTAPKLGARLTVHELRYGYRIERGELVLNRFPESGVYRAYPEGREQVPSVEDVLRVRIANRQGAATGAHHSAPASRW